LPASVAALTKRSTALRAAPATPKRYEVIGTKVRSWGTRRLNSVIWARRESLQGIHESSGSRIRE
jgi:hypothetical protein